MKPTSLSLIALLTFIIAFRLVGQESSPDNSNLLSGPPAVIECADATADVFQPGARLFSDRDYVAEEVPEALRGFKFYRGSIDKGIHATCQQAGMVYVVTPPPDRNRSCSLSQRLSSEGFDPADIPEFLLFNGPADQPNLNRCCVFQKRVAIGESLDFGRWGVLVVPEKDFVLPKSELQKSLDTFVHPPVNFSPGEEYGPDARKYQGIPGIERSPGGRLWAVWYAGKVCEDLYNYIVVATSDDDGRTWSDRKFVIDPDGDGPMRTSDPCFWLDPDGRLWLFWWLNGPGELATVTMAMTTDNPDEENPTWSEPRVICKGVALNKPIVTKDGEWILPTAMWKRDGSCRMMVSSDKGKTWEFRGAANVRPENREIDEPMIVEKKDGSLCLLVRTMTGIEQAVSTDNGRTWSEAADYLPNAVSRFFLRRLSSGNLLLVKHGPLDKQIKRSHLTAYLSEDDGVTWKGGLLLDERNGVSYPDGTQAPDGTIRVIYDFDRAGEKNIQMAVFTEADVLAGEFQSEVSRSRVLVNHATGINPMKKASPASKAGSPLLKDKAAGIDAGTAGEDIFETGAKLFSNRAYVAENVPDELRGCRFIRGNIEGVQAICSQAGLVYVVTPSPHRNNDSLVSEKLVSAGFEKTAVPEFQLFGTDTWDLVSVYQKRIQEGDELNFGKYGVILVPASD